jgi:hypothetical protein
MDVSSETRQRWQSEFLLVVYELGDADAGVF